MPLITEIKRQKNKKRLNIYLDNQFAFGVDEEVWFQNSFQKGDTLRDEDLLLLGQSDNLQKAFDKIFHFLSFRPRSSKEIEHKLQEIKQKLLLSDSQVENIKSKLISLHYLNDSEFGKWWVSERLKKFKGRKIIFQELLQKGLENNLIEELLHEESFDHSSLALKYLEKNQWRFSDNTFATRNKMQNALLRRGFDWDEVRQAVDDFLTKLAGKGKIES